MAGIAQPGSQRIRIPAWGAPAALAAAASAAAGGLALRSPFRPGPWPHCPFHAATGLYCPFCGSTRALYGLLHGDVAVALANNPLLPLLLVGAVWAWLRWVSKLGLIGLAVPAPAGLPARLAIPAVLGVFSVLRNLPGLALLAPHGHL